MKLLSYISTIADPRRKQGQKYELVHVLFFVIIALLSNAKSYREIEDFIGARLEDFKKLFKIKWKRAPDYTQIRNILIALSPEEVEKSFRLYAKELKGENTPSLKDKNTKRRYIAFDGKTLRGSINAFTNNKALQQLFAYDIDSQIILAHVDIDEKSNEIPAVQTLVKELGLSHCVFTADAMHCQKKLLK